jgi:hypothetical protein
MKLLEKLKKWVAAFTTVSLVLAFLPTTALASRSVLSATVNGVAVATVSPSATLNVEVNGQLTNWDDWKGTEYKIAKVDPEDNQMVCKNTPDHEYNGTHSVTLSLVAPSDPGTYNVYIKISGKDDCSGQKSGMLKLTNALIVKEPNRAPSVPTNLSPSGRTKSLTNTLTWGSSTDPDGDTVSYALTWDNKLTPPDQHRGSLLLGGNSYTVAFPHDGKYYWSVKAFDGKLLSEASEEKTLSVDTMPPYVPGLESPADEINVKTKPSLEFRWEGKPADEEEDVKYDFEISESSLTNLPAGSFVTPIASLSKTDLTENKALVAGLEDNTVYYWHVRAKDEAGNPSNWADYYTFTSDNTAPVVETLPDVITSKAVIAEVKATDADTELTYLWSSDPKVVITQPNSHQTEISATEDGEYEVSVTVKDSAGNETIKTFGFTWDSKVSKVADLYAVTGDGFVDLHWTNPSDEDFDGVQIYRSSKKGELGEELATLKPTLDNFSDGSVVNGLTYYYTVRSLDELGNHADSDQVTVTPEAAVVANLNPVAPAAVADAGSSALAPNRSVAGSQTQAPAAATGEVKGGNTNENKDENKSNDDDSARTLSVFGVGLLILLALVGLYLLYLQNPDWFSWLFFWKKKKDKKNLKS